jgi:hypothetical protein
VLNPFGSCPGGCPGPTVEGTLTNPADERDYLRQDNARLKALLIEAGEVGQYALLALGSLAHRCNDDDAYPETRAALASLLAKIDAVK